MTDVENNNGNLVEENDDEVLSVETSQHSGITMGFEPDEMDEEDFFGQAVNDLIVDYAIGQTVQGTVSSIEKEGILLDIGYKSDAFMPNNEIPKKTLVGDSLTILPGDQVDVAIVKLETKEGYTLVSGKRAFFALAWQYLRDTAQSGDPLTVTVNNQVEGGLVAQFNTVKGFIPASHVVSGPDDALENYIGQSLEVVVLSVDQKKKKVVFSAKKARQRPTESQLKETDEFFGQLDSGQVLSGTVTNIKDFGAFVDIGHSIEGLVHISELSWTRVRHPSDVIAVGDNVQVFVLGVSAENRRVSLGMKQLQPDPWLRAQTLYQEGDIVKGVVTRIATFGAFFELQHGIEGLIHISKFSTDRVENVSDVVSEGYKCKAKIIKFFPDKQKIGLSLIGVDQEGPCTNIEEREQQNDSANTDNPITSTEETTVEAN
ncbi:MAG: S1 RNA-binding domain-containing protein [Candidatus Marinamargulisbacteria bacterium]|jgi:small subunit ribosomal protein S1|nr:hypothetical protein [bacterium]MDG2264571.1 S1 RNA-binding domain-containing protein [Candidatus Marinamargulisbacteria bacterium]|tara:strand:- start:2282 stop:3571 length:1290 start_codon:yes stop_codon:yes gene_type:complete